MRCLLVSQDQKLPYMRQLAKALGQFEVETSVLRYFDFASPFPRFSLVPSPRLAAVVSRFRPDVVFTDTYGFDAWVSHSVHCPVIAYMLGDFWQEFRYLYYAPTQTRCAPRRIASMWVRFIHEMGLDFSHTIMPVSRWLAERVRLHRPRKRIKVLYHPFDPRILAGQERTREFHLNHPAIVSLFQFRIWPKLVGLIRFFEVARKMPDVSFYVAGSGPYFNKVMTMNAPSNMTFLGQLEYPTEVKAFLAEGDIYVHPSGQDACPVSIMEAQLMAKPVIASNVGGIPEIVSRAQLLVDYENTEEWIRSITYLLEHQDDWKQIGSDGRKFVEQRFSLEAASKELFEYLQEVVQ